ncbi:MAG: substrate-binding domain-containing protein [Spirochaetia bacterium]|nr:substrate-binding domain-containing protein [Spirochaetia bacterium]MCI7564333.1 substrate-binding domain-containing protein [Spirochaetia bacterium]MDD6930837.1 substrate-binding domain-containing protein [Treponema sp.]MDY5764500.1 substrate-binding domain-containing protein [Treponema sp.]MDY5831445.1 substrate-binding domain-containing protein [Treponema sp.]
MKKIDVKKLVGIAVSACVIFSAFTSCTEEKWNKNSSINVLSREDGSGTRGAFIELFGVEKKNAQGKKVDYTTDEASITNSTAVMLTTVAGNKYAIGYVSLGSLSSSVKAVKIDGVSATVDNINNGSYKIARPFNVAVRNNLSNAAQDFLNYILSSDGQNIIAANKYIKVPAANSYSASGISGKIVVAGSSSVSPVMEKLIEAYKALNPSVQIELQTSDSTTGVINAIDGTCDIGMASRALKDSEKEKGVREVTIAIDGIAVIINNDNPVESLKKSDVEGIFTGKINSWSKFVK